ncbi:MAG: ABC transporter ATP-binding protein [Burkholderiales bacterium]
MSVRLTGVSHRYASSGQGVHAVSMEIAQGELVAVIGASGCGKSTLLRLVAGLLPVQEGRIHIAGQDMSQVSVWQRGVGMVFQSYALFPHLDLIDNVAYGLRMRGVDAVSRRKTALDLLGLVGLSEHATRRPAQLSGGQQQRVALARALAFKPSVLLLDEPLAALDAHIRGQLCDEIKDMQQRFGAATLLVTHDQQEALMVADRVAVMDGGHLLQLASPSELYERPNSVAVAKFVGHANLLAATITAPGQAQTEWGTLTLSTHGHTVGSQVTLLVRPEKIIPDPSPSHPNRFVGQQRRMRYLGPVCRYDFCLQGSPDSILLCEGAQAATHSIAIAPQALAVLPH